MLGFPFVRMVLGEIDRDKIFISTLTGFAMSVIFSAWLVALDIDLKWDLPFLVVISSLGFWSLYFTKTSVGLAQVWSLIKSTKNFFLYSIPIAASAIIYIVLQNNSLRQARISIQNGPDLVGWMSSAKYFCSQQTLSSLSNSIREQIGVSNVFLAFRNHYNFPSTSVYQVPSYSDQINGEFLTSGRRFGLPGLQAGFCRVWGEPALYHTAVALMAVVAILVAVMAVIILRHFRINPVFKMVAILLCALNVNILSVAMEGGFGQFAVTPFLLFVILCLVNSDWRERFLPLALLIFIGFSCATYLDGLFTFSIIFAIFFLVPGGVRLLRSTHPFTNLPKLSVAVLGGFIVGWPIWSSMWRLILERLHQGGTLGGWDQGRFPLPTDFWGLFNWLPSDGANGVPRSSTLKFVEITVLLVILATTIYSRQRLLKHLIFGSTIIYSVLIFVIYKHGLAGSNNYALWKMSGYLSTLIIIGIASSHGRAAKSESEIRGWGFKGERGIPWLIYSLALALIATLTWSHAWIGSRKSSFPIASSQLSSVLNNYDIVVNGYSAGGLAKFALLGDIHYLQPSRGFNIPVKRSIPFRRLAYVLPSSACQTDACLEATFGIKPLSGNQSADANKDIVNGNFLIWKSGKTATGVPHAAAHWTWVTGPNSSITRDAFPLGAAPESVDKPAYFPRWTITGNSMNYEIFQRIKGVRTHQGETVNLSFWARQLSGSTSFQARILQDFGTGGSPSPIFAVPGTAPFLPSKSWKKYTFTFEIPKITNQIFGTNDDSSLWVDFQVANTDIGHLDLWGVRLLPTSYQRIFSSNEFNIYN